MSSLTTWSIDIISQTLTLQAALIDLSIESLRSFNKQSYNGIINQLVGNNSDPSAEQPFDTQVIIMTPLGPLKLHYHRDPAPPPIKDIN